jgi:hypothetical protein
MALKTGLALIRIDNLATGWGRRGNFTYLEYDFLSGSPLNILQEWIGWSSPRGKGD